MVRVPDLAAKKTAVKNQGEASAVPYLRLSSACVTVIYSAIPSSPLSIMLRLHLLTVAEGGGGYGYHTSTLDKTEF